MEIYKICRMCKIEKPILCFGKQSKTKDGFTTWCRDCLHIYGKIRYNKDIIKSRNKNNLRRRDRVLWLQNIKSNTPCFDCKNIYEPYCMDYDHVPEKGIKFNSVSRMVLQNSPKEKILEEIKKCDLVCALCHNKRTYDRFNEKLGSTRKYSEKWQRNINIIKSFKDKPCVICNIKYEYYNMQTDHIDHKTKLNDVCQMKAEKIEVLLNELSKCQVLCALCHRRQSIVEQQNKKYDKSNIGS